MAPIQCTAPECATTFDETLNPQVLLALIRIHDKTVHQLAAAAQTNPKPEKVKRPTIALAGTSEEFLYFKQRWNGYKNATKLQDADIVFQLLECCEEPLRKDLTRVHGDLTTDDEETVLQRIQTLAVRPENHLVARVQLLQMHQDRDEPILSFCAKLKGQASVCRFTKKCICNADVDYSDEIVRDCLIRNIADEDIKLEVLGQVNQDISLDETIQLIEAKESGKRSAHRIQSHPPVSSAALNSSHRRQTINQRPQPNRRQNNNDTAPRFRPKPCSHCGQTGHSGNLDERMKKCPAYNKQCQKCLIHHHHHSVCRSPKPPQQSASGISQSDDFNSTSVVYNTLCNATYNNDTTFFCDSITLDHHIYENLNNTWSRRHSDPQPTVEVSVSIHPSDATDLNLPVQTKSSPNVEYLALTDTCCQSSLAGEDLLQKLNLNRDDLYPVSMSMTAANNRSINILGALPLRITGTSPSGTLHTTRQIVYFSDHAKNLFLSKQACLELGIIA